MRHAAPSIRRTVHVGLGLVIATSVAFALSSFASGASKRSAVSAKVAYEPFCYPTNSAPGSTGSGWSAGWVANGALVSSPGLAFPGFPTVGAPCAASSSLGPTPAGPSSRALASPLTRLGSAGVILRGLIRSKVPGTPETQATLGNLGGGTLTIGDLAQAPTVAAAANWGIQVNGGATFYSAVPVQQNVTTALTVRVDFGAGTGGQDLVRFWVQTAGTYCDPTGSVSAPSCAGFSGGPPVSANVMSQFSSVFWQTQDFAQGGALVDEISVDAIPFASPPPPGTLCVQKYWDRDEDGTQQIAFEPNLPGWTMNASGGPSAPFSLTTLSGQACTRVLPGSYTLTEVAQPGWSATTPTSQTVTVSSYGLENVKFGNRGVCDPNLPTSTYVDIAGGVDDFAGPEPATMPLGFGAPSRFDWARDNQPFFHEFRGLPNWRALCQVKLEIRVMPLNGGFNDNITLSSGDAGPVRWQQYFAPANPVAPGTELVPTGWGPRTAPVLFTWTFDANGGLPPGNNSGDDVAPKTGKTLFEKFRLNVFPRRPLDISIQDDTSVDYIRMTLLYQ